MTTQVKTMEGGHKREHEVLEEMYDALQPPGQKTIDFSMERMANERNLSQNVLAGALVTFQRLHIVKKEGPIYGSKTNGLGIGRHFNYTLLMPLSQAQGVLTSDQADRIEAAKANRITGAAKGVQTRVANRQKRSDRAAQATRQFDSETVYVSGDDADTIGDRFERKVHEAVREQFRDEPAALVEAARQYVKRRAAVAPRVGSSLDELEREAQKMGITFDREMFLSMFPEFQTDPVELDERLEAVALVLPYIDELEQEIADFKFTANVQRQLNKKANGGDAAYSAH